MDSKSLKNRGGEAASTATSGGPKPADFLLGSMESRAAARAMVHRLAEKDGPQPGDIFINLDFLGPKRAAEIYLIARNTPMSGKTLDRIPSKPKMWIKCPEGFNPDSLPEGTPPVTLDNAPEDLMRDLLGCYNEGLRKAKQSGHSLPPGLDPDLVWNGMAYVPKQTVPKVAG